VAARGAVDRRVLRVRGVRLVPDAIDVDAAGLHAAGAGDEDELRAVDAAYGERAAFRRRAVDGAPLLAVEGHQAARGQREERALVPEHAEGDVDGPVVGAGQAVPRLAVVARGEDAFARRRELPHAAEAEDLFDADRRVRGDALLPLDAVRAVEEAFVRAGDELHVRRGVVGDRERQHLGDRSAVHLLPRLPGVARFVDAGGGAAESDRRVDAVL